ncbi:MAG: hypothetical protein EOM92_19330 [Gammaproteobacteria bacterium]|nr:hypothetical protein [Gammaproteobacteria bacterium]NCC23507.1 hypothetical protein [Alphaproteobacteria bacterium]
MNRKPRLFLGTDSQDNDPVFFSGEGSLLTVGPPGTGKSRGVAVWNLLEYPGSMLVTDPKGQLVQWSAAHRAGKHGQDIAVLDPFGITGVPSASVNPLAGLVQSVAGGQGFRSEAERLAHLLLPDRPGDKDPFWRAGARDLIITGLLYLAKFEPENCDLPGLHDVLWRSEAEFLDGVIQKMQKETGACRQYANDVADTLETQPKSFGYFRKEARQALSIFAPDEPCGQACKHSDIDLGKLITGKLTVYLVLPPELVSSHGKWMGLITAHAIHAIMRVRQNGECLFLLDEFPNLGRLTGIRDAIAQLREKGLRVWIFVQDLSQLKAVYGEDDAAAMRWQAELLQVLGCRSVELARYIESRAGTVSMKDVSFTIQDPTGDDSPPSASLKEMAFPVIPAATALNMPIGRQVIIRAGRPVMIGNVMIWGGPHA